ncbi:MAG TPA: ferredoxin family protein [Pelotomaculum sp.]|nr:ferredoxin family protein [Pelotomaculum sp.]
MGVEQVRRHHHNYAHRHGARHGTAYIAVNTRLCQACWKCVAACPKGVLGKMDFIFHRHVRLINPGNCTGCLACVKSCPEGAIISLK